MDLEALQLYCIDSIVLFGIKGIFYLIARYVVEKVTELVTSENLRESPD